MLSLRSGQTLVAATHNPGKAREIAALLEDRFLLKTAAELGLAEPDETETTFVGNAVLKARAAAQGSGLVAIADDSGLSVLGLGGQPGVLSARWAETEAGVRDFTFAMDRIEQALKAAGSSDRRAFFSCALAVAWPDGPVVAVEGRVDGELVFPPRGQNGFGYDPIFTPTGGALTFGEMKPKDKDAISHRAVAFEKLKAALW